MNTHLLHELTKEEAELSMELEKLLQRGENELYSKTESSTTAVKSELVSGALKEQEGVSAAALSPFEPLQRLSLTLSNLKLAQEAIKMRQRARQLTGRFSLKEEGWRAKPLEDVIEMAQEWKTLTSAIITGFDSADIILGSLEERSTVDQIVDKDLPDAIEQAMQAILLQWTDDHVDRRNLQLLGFPDGEDFGKAASNPLLALFASFPLNELSRLRRLQELVVSPSMKQLKAIQYVDRLLNRFYDILNGAQSTGVEGLLEEMTSNSMKWATRFTCILEARRNFLLLHSGDVDIQTRLTGKTCQIIRQLRKAASQDRNYSNPKPDPVLLDANLNEIALIRRQLSAVEAIGKEADETPEHPAGTLKQMDSELQKWQEKIYEPLEGLYLRIAIERALQLDQINAQDSEFPVSSCIDDIFFCLRSAALGRQAPPALLEFAFQNHFLQRLKVLLEENLKKLKLALPQSSQKESLIAILLLLNNLSVAEKYWTSLRLDSITSIPMMLAKLMTETIEENIYPLLMRKAIETKYLHSAITISTLLSSILNLFQDKDQQLFLEFPWLKMSAPKIRLLIQREIVREFSGKFMELFFDKSGDGGDNACELNALRLDRQLHELKNQLLTGDLDDDLVLEPLAKMQQIIALLMSESVSEAQGILQEWRSEDSLKLRAGEIATILGMMQNDKDAS